MITSDRKWTSDYLIRTSGNKQAPFHQAHSNSEARQGVPKTGVDCIVPKSHALVRQAPVDDHSASLLHTMIETASDDDGWAELAHGGVLLTKETP